MESFEGEGVLVTVGTTQFDVLVEAVATRAFAETLARRTAVQGAAFAFTIFV